MKKVIFLVTSCALFLFTSCENNDYVGDGAMISKDLKIERFDQIISSGSFNVIVSKGDVQKVTVTGYSNIINQLETKVQDGIWNIELKKGHYKNDNLTINIVIPELNAVALEGSGEIRINDFKSTENVAITLSGSGNIFVDENEGCKNLVVTIDGSGNVYAQENFINLLCLNVKISGSGSYDGFANSAVISNLAIEGSGFCNVFAVETLNANINGSGSVNYKGNPAVTSKIKGSGKVNNEN